MKRNPSRLSLIEHKSENIQGFINEAVTSLSATKSLKQKMFSWSDVKWLALLLYSLCLNKSVGVYYLNRSLLELKLYDIKSLAYI